MEISLDSVVRKAGELEVSLRSCRARMSTLAAHKGRASDSHHPPPPPSLCRALSLPAAAAASVLPASTDAKEQWQRLTAYIVSLEKEVQYYKQLLQDMQTSHQQEASSSSPSSSRERSSLAKRIERPTEEHWKALLEQEPENEVLLLVFSYLSVRELCSAAALVCYKWHQMTRHPHLWRELVMSETVVHPEALSNLAGCCCSSTKRLVLHGLMPPPATHDEDLQSYIINTRGSLEPGLKAVMEASQDTLTSLTVTECNLMATERVLWLASVHCPNLRSLTYCSEEFPLF